MSALRPGIAVLRFVWNHPANRGKRFRALLRAVRFQVRGRTGRPTQTPIGESTRMWAVLHRASSSKVVYGNPPDYPEMMAWRRLLEPDDLFMDVGSNVGVYSLWAIDCGAEAIAVEPSADTVALLRENLALNGNPRVEVHQCALAGVPGEMWLSEGRDSTNHLMVGSTSGERVEVRTLDDLLGERTAAGVKIDVEGAERLVLEGATRALSEHRIQVLQLEWNSMSRKVLGEDRSPVEALLRTHGYTFARPDEAGHLHPTEDVRMGADIFALAPGHKA